MVIEKGNDIHLVSIIRIGDISKITARRKRIIDDNRKNKKTSIYSPVAIGANDLGIIPSRGNIPLHKITLSG